MKPVYIHGEVSHMSQQQFDLMLAIANKAGIRLYDIEAMGQNAGQWYLEVRNWGWVSTSELLKGAKNQ